MDFDFNVIITYIACIFFLFILGKILIVPLKTILKLILNSILGGFLIWVMNLIGASFHFHIGLNLITSIFVGLLGIPGAIVMVIIKLLIL